MSIIIDYDQLASECLARCDELATCTETPGQITRGYLTPPMHAVHAAATGWFEDVGMTVRVDAAGNLIGTRPCSEPDAKTLLIGSHLDTVPDAGRFDGILGFVAGIAVVKALQGVNLPFAIDVIGFSEEEGVRFSTPYLGSRAVTGGFQAHWQDLVDSHGHSMRQVIESFGLVFDEIPLAVYPPDRVLGFIEAHIEQGPVLSRMNLPVAAVESIAGQSRLKMLFHGRAGHAGTTPMTPRADALVAAAQFILAVSQHGQATDGLRATVGSIKAAPNVRNVIPGDVEVSLDVRHSNDSVRANAVTKLCELARRCKSDGLTFTITERQEQPASAMDSSLTNLLCQSIIDSGHDAFSMLSGAGHDAVVMAERFPTAMLFIRQPNGVSHHPDEDVELRDVAIAIEVLTRFVQQLADQ